MRFCPSFHTVQLMHQGKSPNQACDLVVKRITEYVGSEVEVALIALDIKVRSSQCDMYFHKSNSFTIIATKLPKTQICMWLWNFIF